MKTKVLATFGAASLALAMSNTASHALLGFEPGESMGIATGAALPEGVFAVDTELYGKRDGNPGHTGLNIPILIWSTPVTFYNTRLEFAYAGPFFHSDSYQFNRTVQANGLTDGQTRIYNQAIGTILAHDFGGGFGASLTTLFHPADQRYIPHDWADLRGAISYTGNGFDITAQFGYTGTFGSKNSIFAAGAAGGQSVAINSAGTITGNPADYGSIAGFSDAINVDFTATKTFNKFEIGFVGFAHEDIENGIDNANVVALNGSFATSGFTRAAAVGVGGLVGYDFGKVNVQASVTREVASRGAPQLNGTGKETRGFIRLIVPLYVAPAAPAPVVARY